MAETIKPIAYSPLVLNGLAKYLSISSHRSVERMIYTFTELGIADMMSKNAGPITAKQLSQFEGNDWNASFLYRLLRVIVDAGIIREVNTDGIDSLNINNPEEIIQFELTEDGVLLTKDHDSRARDIILCDIGPASDKLASFTPSLIKFGYKYGNGFEQAFGLSLFDYMQKPENKDYATIFNNTMIGYTNSTITYAVANIDFNRFHRLVDLAGGLGTLLAAILEKNPNLYGILLDMEHAIEQSKNDPNNEFRRRKIEANRYELVVGDIFNSETIPSADAYALKYIIHDWDDEKSLEILRGIRSANIQNTGKKITIFIVEMIVVTNDRSAWEVHAMDVEMMSYTGARERRLKEYIDLLEKSGFEFKKLYELDGRVSAIEADTIIN